MLKDPNTLSLDPDPEIRPSSNPVWIRAFPHIYRYIINFEAMKQKSLFYLFF